MQGKNLNKLSSPIKAYKHLYHAIRSFPRFKVEKDKEIISEQFKERIMLAVTEVNGCALCAYAHTQIALESGMSGAEIDTILAGNMDAIPDSEIPAVFFAQHYADTDGKPTEESWERIKSEYGTQQSQAILHTIRMIMAGNTYGIPFGSFKSRFSKKNADRVDQRSTIGYELGMIISIVPFIPLAIIHASLAKIFKKPPIQFE